MNIAISNSNSDNKTNLKVLRTGVFRNALQQFQRGLPKMIFMKNKHEDCANFDNGTCIAAPRIFNFTNLKPKGHACPHLKAKKIAETENQNKNLQR